MLEILQWKLVNHYMIQEGVILPRIGRVMTTCQNCHKPMEAPGHIYEYLRERFGDFWDPFCLCDSPQSKALFNLIRRD